MRRCDPYECYDIHRGRGDPKDKILFGNISTLMG